MKRGNKGITLVALVITIIVLIILAGVSINAVMNKGLIENAKEAKNEFEEAKTEEEKVLSKLEAEAIDAKVEQVFKANGVEYNFKKTYLTNINFRTKATDLMQKLATVGYDLYDVQGNKITAETPDTTYVTTGMQLKEGNKKIGTVIIFGDTNCDGDLTAVDGSLIQSFLAGGIVEEYQILAMDINHNECVDYNDSNYILNSKKGGDVTYINNQNYYVINVDELLVKDRIYLNNEYITALNAANKGYTITKEGESYILNGITAETDAADLISALKISDEEIEIYCYNIDDSLTEGKFGVGDCEIYIYDDKGMSLEFYITIE